MHILSYNTATDFSLYVKESTKTDIPAGTPLKTIGSVFNLSQEGVDFFTKHRLYPQPNSPQSLWGCSSIGGFLAKGEDVLGCCNKDKKTLEERKISYKTIVDRLHTLVSHAETNEAEKSKELKFSVKVGAPSMCSQFCPFSPVSDAGASPIAIIKNACGQANHEVEITNTGNGKSIKFSSLLLHLIEEHNFFEGNVSHRLDPENIIDTLELPPDPEFSLCFPAPLPQPASIENNGRWELSGVSPTKKETLEAIVRDGDPATELCEGISYVILPYDNWGRTFPGIPVLHLFNFSNEVKKISGVFKGVSLQDASTYPNARVCYLLSKPEKQ